MDKIITEVELVGDTVMNLCSFRRAWSRVNVNAKNFFTARRIYALRYGLVSVSAGFEKFLFWVKCWGIWGPCDGRNSEVLEWGSRADPSEAEALWHLWNTILSIHCSYMSLGSWEGAHVSWFFGLQWGSAMSPGEGLNPNPRQISPGASPSVTLW